jgi:nucleoside-diphosphate-sugar epimerase
MKILLTGGAGYLGNIVTRKLLDQKHEVVIIDNLIHGSEGCTGLFQIQLNDNSCLIKDDIKNIKKYDNHFQDVDIVFHFAAPRLQHIHSSKEIDDSLEDLKVLYDLSVKHKSELLLEDYNEINTILARQATLFGVSNLMRNDLMINNFVKSVKEKKEFDVYGKDTWRPNLDVSDCANILLKLVEKEFSGLVNVGTDSLNLSKQDIIDEIPRAIGIDISKYVNYESSNGRTDWPPSHDSRSYKVAFTKLKDLIGGKFIDLNKGIRRLYERNRTV